MTTTRTATVDTLALKVPGATLHVEVRGTGPVLVCIPVGPADAGVFDQIAPLLADRYTVVAYDPRGNSRSVLDGDPTDVEIERHADDAAAVIAATSGTAPAYVLGSSGGASIGLELVRRHAERVKVLVAHEPPVLRLLPADEGWVARIEDILETYRAEGLWPAMAKFGAAVEEGGPAYEPNPNPTPDEIEAGERIGGNLEFFVKHVLREISLYEPDIDALEQSGTPIAVGSGEESAQQSANRAGIALCERLGVSPTPFPGAHGGFSSHPDEFAKRLDAALQRN